MVYGVQYVMTTGISMMLGLFVDNLDCHLIVRKSHFSNSGPFVFIHLLCVVPQALNGSIYGAGDGPKLLNNLHCIGDEVSIEDCLMISGVDHHSCGSEEVASVVCSNGTYI